MLAVILIYSLIRYKNNPILQKIYCLWILIVYRSLWNMRVYVHIMLCGSLFISQLVFIIGVDKTQNKVWLLLTFVL